MNYFILKLLPIHRRLCSMIDFLTEKIEMKYQIWRLQKALHIQKNMMLELRDSSNYIQLLMSAKFMVYIMLGAFIVYLLLFRPMEQIYMIFFCIVGAGHACTIGFLINRCDKIARHNMSVAGKLLKVYNRLLKLRLFSMNNLVKLETNIASLFNFTSGYKMLNGMLIDSRCYFLVRFFLSLFCYFSILQFLIYLFISLQVIYHTSIFFFLVFNRG